MTLQSSTNQVMYEGDGATAEFSYSFLIFSAEDLTVTLRNAQGDETVLELDSDYSVSNVGVETGGNVTLIGPAPAVGESLKIERVIDLVQLTELPGAGPFPPASVERMGDRAVMIAQQLHNFFDRCMKVKTTTDISGVSLVLPDPDAGKGIKWNAAADGLTNTIVDPDNAAAEIADIRDQAQDARDAAQDAEGAAESARNDAQDARDAAQTAQGLAQTAQGLAETARDAAQAAEAGATAAAETTVGELGHISGLSHHADGGDTVLHIRSGKITLQGVMYTLPEDTNIDVSTYFTPNTDTWYMWGFQAYAGSQDQLIDDFELGQAFWVDPANSVIRFPTWHTTRGGWYQLWSGPGFVGTGLDDLEIDFVKTHNGLGGQHQVKITQAGATDYFQFSTDVGSTWNGVDIAVTGDWQQIGSSQGPWIRFGAATGHTVDDYWKIWVFTSRRVVGWFKTDGSGNILAYGLVGDRMKMATPLVLLDTTTPATSITALATDTPIWQHRLGVGIMGKAQTATNETSVISAADGDRTSLDQTVDALLAVKSGFFGVGRCCLRTNLYHQIKYARTFITGPEEGTTKLSQEFITIPSGMARE